MVCHIRRQNPGARAEKQEKRFRVVQGERVQENEPRASGYHEKQGQVVVLPEKKTGAAPRISIVKSEPLRFSGEVKEGKSGN